MISSELHITQLFKTIARPLAGHCSSESIAGRMKPLRCLFALLLAAAGLRAADEKPDYDPSVVLKIVIRADDAILVDGVSTKLSEVPAKLTALSERKGVVWFYRANPEGEPPPNSMEVLKMIIDARRPVQLFTKEDFSETVGPDDKPKKAK